MRGNEGRVHSAELPQLPVTAFPIPMRGNENADDYVVARHYAGLRFPIPMRGNEARLTPATDSAR